MTPVRAAFHVHSDWSYDGKWSLERIANAFSRRGYRVVMMTEHDRGFSEMRRQEHREACRKASSDQICLIPGIEYSDNSNCVHILTWGEIPFIGENMETSRVLDVATEYRGVSIFAHPGRKSAWKRFEPEWSKKLAGIEFWNRKTDGWAPSKEAWQLLRTTKSLPFAGMDFHDSRQLFPLSTILQIDADVTETTILEALKAKRCESQVFGIPLESFSHGVRGVTVRWAESMRRHAVQVYRKFVSRSSSSTLRANPTKV
jgi:hypothetical protein